MTLAARVSCPRCGRVRPRNRDGICGVCAADNFWRSLRWDLAGSWLDRFRVALAVVLLSGLVVAAIVFSQTSSGG